MLFFQCEYRSVRFKYEYALSTGTKIVVLFMFVCLMRDEKCSSSFEVEKCPLIKVMTLIHTPGPWHGPSVGGRWSAGPRTSRTDDVQWHERFSVRCVVCSVACHSVMKAYFVIYLYLSIYLSIYLLRRLDRHLPAPSAASSASVGRRPPAALRHAFPLSHARAHFGHAQVDRIHR